METRKKELKETYKKIKPTIESRIEEFESIWEEGDENKIFEELTFCLFTPQSKAKKCWKAVQDLKEKELFYEACEDAISEEINQVRFRNNKAGYFVEARDKFEGISFKEKLEGFQDPKRAREWIVENVKGLGYKEAGHFLRNIGYTQDLAILDRHILKNLEELGVLEEIPKTLTKRSYLEIEKKMKEFSEEIDIPLGHLDLVLWYLETGHVFK